MVLFSDRESHNSFLFDGVGGGVFGANGGFRLIFIELHKFGKIELWFFEDLDLSDHAVVLKWEDFAAFVLDLFANFFFDENLNEFLKSVFLDGLLHNFHHLLSNDFLMGVFGITCGLNLSLGSLGESDTEKSEDISIGGLCLNESLNE